MKQFYTVRDIEDMHAAGVVEIEIHDDVVLTDVAREKAISLGMQLIPVEEASLDHRGPGLPRLAVAAQPKNTAPGADTLPGKSGPPASSPALPQTKTNADTDRVMKIKAAVVARLGTDKYNDLLDSIIPQVMSQLNK